MTEYIFTNNAKGTLLTAMGATDITLTLQSGEGTDFPDPSGSEGFAIKVKGGGNEAWMICTGVSGDVLTVTRTDSYTFPAGSVVIHALDATALNLFLQKGVHRTNDGSPDGSLSASYTGEEVLDSTNGLWYKHITGTTWKLMNGTGS